MNTFRKAILGLCCAFMLVAPVALLLLAPLSKAGSLAVVTGFGALFMLFLSSLEMKPDALLVGVSAYFAVLVSLLSNLV
jgi:hypothetical protein